MAQRIDAVVQGEQRLVTQKVTASTGTMTIAALPKVFLYDGAVQASVKTGAASATQTLDSTAGMLAGDSLWFADTTGGVARVINSITDETTVVLTATITTLEGDSVRRYPHADWHSATPTGFDAGAAATVNIWHNVNTASPVFLRPGVYLVVFEFTATASSDSIARKYRQSSALAVLPRAV